MLYIDEVRELPSGDGIKLFFVKSRTAGEHFVQYRTGSSYTDASGKRHNQRVTIGKTVTVMTESGEEKTVFHPNETYFTVMHEEPPRGAVLRSSGRPKAAQAEPQEYERADEGSVLCMGYGLAFHKEAADLGLTSALASALGDKDAMTALAVASYYAKERERGLTLLAKHTERNLCFTGRPVDDRRACELFASFTDAKRAAFFDEWMPAVAEKAPEGKERRFVFYDVTSVSSYSECIRWVAYGYNRDRESLKQVNIGLFMDESTGLPLYCTWYDGSVNDASNFRHVLKEAQERGLDRNITVVGDGIFSDRKCVSFMAERGYSMIVGISAQRCGAVFDGIAQWRRRAGAEGTEEYLPGTDGVSSHEVPFETGGVRGRLVMYHDDFRAPQELSDLTAKYRKALAELRACDFTLTSMPGRFIRRAFDVTHDRKAGTWKVSENRDRLAACRAQCGSFALFTTLNPEKDRQTPDWHMALLERYREKDACEKTFAAIKNDMIGERMFSHSSEGWQGKLPVVFTALTVRKSLDMKLRPWIRAHHKSLDYAFEVLGEIRCRKRKDHWVLENSLTREQKEVCAALGLDLSIMEKTLYGS